MEGNRGISTSALPSETASLKIILPKFLDYNIHKANLYPTVSNVLTDLQPVFQQISIYFSQQLKKVDTAFWLRKALCGTFGGLIACTPPYKILYLLQHTFL